MNQKSVNKNGQPQTQEPRTPDSTQGKKGHTIKQIVGSTSERIRYAEATRNAYFIE
jgi:hypothetical protein